MEALKNIYNNSIFRTIIFIFAIIVLLITLLDQWMRFNSGLNKFTLIKNVHSGKQDVVIKYKYIPQSTYGHVATYSTWLHIDDYKYKYDTAKHIFHFGDKDMKHVSPGLWFYPKRNNLAVKFSVLGKEVGFTNGKLGKATKGKKCIFPYKINWDKLGIQKPIHKDPNMKIFNCETTADEHSEHGYCPTEVDSSGYVTDINKFGSCSKKSMDPNVNKQLLTIDGNCDIENVPLNRWFHLAITVKDDSVEVYIDGKLSKSCVYENLPLISKGDLWITNKGGFDGKLTQFKVIPYYLTHSEIRTIYMRGPDNKNTVLGGIPPLYVNSKTETSFEIKDNNKKSCESK
jgi:hypothetical protein